MIETVLLAPSPTPATDFLASILHQQRLAAFGRVKDVQKEFGIKRGILYRWIAENKIKSVCLREPGNKQGIRLIDMESVRDYITSQMQTTPTS